MTGDDREGGAPAAQGPLRPREFAHIAAADGGGEDVTQGVGGIITAEPLPELPAAQLCVKCTREGEAEAPPRRAFLPPCVPCSICR